ALAPREPRELVVELSATHDPSLVVPEVESRVGRVRVLVGEPEPEEETRLLRRVRDRAHEGDRAAFADEAGLGAEGLLEGAEGGREARVLYVRDPGKPSMEVAEVHLDLARRDLADEG